MYFSSRSAFVRNVAVAMINGAVTLVILLIAPLGLAAVIINTLLVVMGSFITATVADQVVKFLQPNTMDAEVLPRPRGSSIRQQENRDDLDRR
jgi:hypothetical protein